MTGTSLLSRIILSDIEELRARLDCGGLKRSRFLVTGSSGLIGIYFLALLRGLLDRSEGTTVTLVVLSNPTPMFLELADHPRIDIRQGDVGDPLFCRSLPQADFIVHSAGYGQPGLFMANPATTLALNTIGTAELFGRLAPNGRFLFASSAEVYTGLDLPLLRETDIGTTNTDHPRACYIEGKRTGEALCFAYRKRGVAAKAARIALTYGPGTKPHDRRVLNMFIEKALSGRIDLMDSGAALRTLIYIADTVEALWNILMFGRHTVYNVGGEAEISILDLAREIGLQMNVPVRAPEADEGVAGAPQSVRLDMSRYRDEFGPQALLPLNEGLARTIAWQRALYRDAASG